MGGAFSRKEGEEEEGDEVVNVDISLRVGVDAPVRVKRGDGGVAGRTLLRRRNIWRIFCFATDARDW